MDRFAPVCIRKSVLATLERDRVTSPQNRVLMQRCRAELWFRESEVLIAAKNQVDGIDLTQDEGCHQPYMHMLFDQHEIVFVSGATTESFDPGDIGFHAVGDKARQELSASFPELCSGLGPTSRRRGAA